MLGPEDTIRFCKFLSPSDSPPVLKVSANMAQTPWDQGLGYCERAIQDELLVPLLPFCYRAAFTLRFLPELLVCVSALAVHLADFDHDLFPDCPWIYPIPMDPQSDLNWGWPWYYHWTCSILLAGVPQGCILCVWGHCHTVTHTHSSPLMLVHLPLLLPDCFNRWSRSKLLLSLLKACSCLCSPLLYPKAMILFLLL